jgi:hypothetical protein
MPAQHWILPFHLRLCAGCQVLRAERRLRGVLLACLPRLEAAKAHKTNLFAGKRRCSGTCSSSQRRMNCFMVPAYLFIIDSAQPLWIAWFTLSRAHEETTFGASVTLKKTCWLDEDVVVGECLCTAGARLTVVLSRHVPATANPKVCLLTSTVLGRLFSSALRRATQW